MPKIPTYEQQTSTPSGERRVAVGPTDQSGAMLTGLANAVTDAAGVVGATIQRKRDAQATALDAYDRQQDALRRVEAKEWADNAATDALLRKHERMTELKRQIPADADFLEEWRKEEAAIDAEVKGSAPAGNPYFGNALDSQLSNQRQSFQLAALQYREASRAVKTEFDFEKKIDTNRKILQKLPALDADAKAFELVREMEADAGLALLPPNQAEALAEKKRQDLAETVFEQHLQNPEDAQNLLNAIDGAGRVHFVRKAGTNRANGKPISGGKWDSKLRAAAEKYDLDPSLLIAMMKRESTGDEHAVSPKGAQGLLQLMPGTARDLGVDPSDPDQNIDGGARYLAQQIERFGSVAKGLAAYNAGPGNLSSAIRKAEAAGRPNDWREFLPKPKETVPYVAEIMNRAGIKGDGSDQYEAIQEEGIKIQALEYATPEQIAKFRNQAESYVAQAARARTQQSRDELHAREASTKTAAATGAEIKDPVTIGDYLAAGYDPQAAVVRMALLRPYQEMAPFVREMANMPKAQRDAEVAKRDPAGTGAAGYDFDAKSDAYKLAKAANESIDKQIAADPAGYAVRQNPSVKRAKETLDIVLQTPGVPAVNIRASVDAYVAEVSSFQKAQGVETPAILPQNEADAIKSSWYGQADGPLRAAETMSQLATVYGQHYGGVLRQLAKDLPSEALWVGQLASDPATLGVRQQLAAASKTWPALADIPARKGIENAVDAEFANYQNSLRSTSADGGARAWAQLRDGAVKLAALKAAQSGAKPEVAARHAFAELVGNHVEFFKADRVVSAFGGEAVYNSDVIRVPKTWRGKALNQEPEDVVDGAKKWLRQVLPAMEFQADRSQAVFRADIKERGGWVTSPEDDGLVLMLGAAPVRTKDGKLVKISWTEAADLAEMPEEDGPGFVSRALRAVSNWFIAPPTPAAKPAPEPIPRQRNQVGRIPEGIDLRKPMQPLPGAPRDRQFRR